MLGGLSLVALGVKRSTTLLRDDGGTITEVADGPHDLGHARHLRVVRDGAVVCRKVHRACVHAVHAPHHLLDERGAVGAVHAFDGYAFALHVASKNRSYRCIMPHSPDSKRSANAPDKSIVPDGLLF